MSMTDKELDDLEAWLREGPKFFDTDKASMRDAADAIAELREKNAGLVGALKPFAEYGGAIKGQRISHDRPLLELWKHKITGTDLIQAFTAYQRKGE